MEAIQIRASEVRRGDFIRGASNSSDWREVTMASEEADNIMLQLSDGAVLFVIPMLPIFVMRLASETAEQHGAGTIDLPGLRAALGVLSHHRELIADAMEHLEAHVDGADFAVVVEYVAAGIDHIVNDDFRSSETPGGS